MLYSILLTGLVLGFLQKVFLKSTSGINFFPKVSGHKRSLISPLNSFLRDACLFTMLVKVLVKRSYFLFDRQSSD